MNELFLTIVNRSISASWLILAVLLLRFALKKAAPKWVNVLLWGIVAVRLLCPFSFESALSLIPSAETIPLNIEMDTTPSIHSGIDAINNAVNPILYRSNTPMAGASANPLQITVALLESLWILGMLAMAVYAAVSYGTLRRRVRTAVRCKDNIFRSENVCSPFVLGIVKPKIYLPFTQESEHVLAHEQAHIHRKDHWWKPLGFLLLMLHWFNPLMWLAYALLCRDIELACDERVIKALNPEQRADYTQALVACSVSRRSLAACPIAFGEGNVKERVKSVLQYKKPAFWVIVAAVVVCAAVAVCFLTDPKTEPPALLQWFDFTEDLSDKESPLTTELPAFPDVTFRYTSAEITATDPQSNEPTVLISGMPVWSAYFCDLNGDGLPELCADCSFGSGIIDERIAVYDCANGVGYELSDRGNYDFTLCPTQTGLCVQKTKYGTGETVALGRLLLKNNVLQMEEISSDQATEYYLTIGSEGVKSIEYSLSGESGGVVNADGSLYKKGTRLWLEFLNGRTDLRGLTLKALDENGETVWRASIPNTDNNSAFTHLNIDGWELTNLK